MAIGKAVRRVDAVAKVTGRARYTDDFFRPGMLVAGYLSVALVQNRKEAGLILGTTVFKDIITTFWDGLFPPKRRAKGRVRIIEWWRDKTEALLERMSPLSFTRSEMDGLVKDLAEIDRFLEQNLKGAPSTLTVKRLLERIATVKEEAKRPEKEAGEERHAPAARPPGPLELSSMDDAKRGLNAVLSNMKRIASFLRDREPDNPLAYKIWRTALWLPIHDLPPSDNGNTKVPAPQPQVVSALAALKGKGDWSALVGASEARLAQFPLWLALNYYTSHALSGLGEGFSRAAKAVESETVALIGFLKGLEHLRFADGTPFANTETLGWIRGLVGGSGSGVPDAAGAAESEDAQSDADICGEARALAVSKGLLDAVGLLQKGIENCESARRRFQLRACLVELLTGSKKDSLVEIYIVSSSRD